MNTHSGFKSNKSQVNRATRFFHYADDGAADDDDDERDVFE